LFSSFYIPFPLTPTQKLPAIAVLKQPNAHLSGIYGRRQILTSPWYQIKLLSTLVCIRSFSDFQR
jgi:hypothetical protein